MITDAQARRIAAEWHAPNCPGLTALSTAGAITPSTEPEVRAEHDHISRTMLLSVMAWDEQEQAHRDLGALLEYVQHHGVRPAQPGWHRIWSEVRVA